MTTNGNVITGGSNEVLHSLHPRLKWPELWRGCVGAWAPSMGKTGEKLFDYSGYGNHGTLTNMDPATDWVTSEGKGALDFDGTNDYVECGKADSAKVHSGDMAVALWMYSQTSWSGAGLVSQSNSLQFLAGQDGQGVRFVRNGTSLTTANTSYTSRLISVIYSQKGSTGTIYARGVSQVSGTMDTLSNYGGHNLNIGRQGWNSSNYYPGYIDDIRIYNRALSHQEIKILASSRGAAYQKRKVTSVLFSSGTPASNRRNNMLIGCGF